MVSTDGVVYVKFYVLLLGASLGSLYGLQVHCTEGTELWPSGGRLLVTTLGTYDDIELGLSQLYSTAECKFEVSVDEIYFVTK